MSFGINDNTKNMILAYLLFVLSLFYFKPNILFKPNGTPREYGLGVDTEGVEKTLFSLHFVIIVTVFLIYFQYTKQK